MGVSGDRMTMGGTRTDGRTEHRRTDGRTDATLSLHSVKIDVSELCGSFG